MESKYPPELQAEITKRRNSGDLRYDFINDDLIAKEILKEQSESPKNQTSTQPPPIQTQRSSRDPEVFLKQVFKEWLTSSQSESWYWSYKDDSKWVVMGFFGGKKFPEQYIDETLLKDSFEVRVDSRLWTTRRSVDRLLEFIGNRR